MVRKSTRFTTHTQRVPPKVPVYSYHCTQLIFSEKAFPRLSQGQENSQLRCRYSKHIQMATRKTEAFLKSVLFATIWYSRNTRVMSRELTVTAKIPPKAVEK